MKSLSTTFVTLLFLLVGFMFFSASNAANPEETRKASEAFLTDNAKKSGIKTTASGLQYEILTAGKGNKSPKATDTVSVHYRGTTIDGKEFDSSYARGEPTSFPLNAVIPGWTEGVQLMKVGDKYRFYIPSQLAYGERGAGRAIAPNAALIFDIELIAIQ